AERRGLDGWLNFAAAGKGEIWPGRGELGRGVLPAMARIAAEELDVTLDRVVVRSGITERTPNEGYTAGSQSMQAGGIALRQACAEARARFLDHAAQMLDCAAAELSVRDGRVLRNAAPKNFDYWSLRHSVRLDVDATGTAARNPATHYTIVGRDAARLDLPAKLFGAPVFVHDMRLDGMAHARVVRQPNRDASLIAFDEAATRRAARGPIAFVPAGNFMSICGAS